MLGQFLLLMLLATQEAMFEIHFARELYSLIMNYIFGDSLPPYMSWRGQWESNLPLWRPDEMSYGAMVTSCSTVAEKIIGLWRFTKRPASRRTRQWLVYIGIMKETLAKRNGEIDLHIVLQNYQFSHQKKKRYFYLWIMRVDTPPKFNGWNLKIMMMETPSSKSPQKSRI